MSAQVAFPAHDVSQTPPTLSLLPPVRSKVSTVGFGLIILVLVALGMALVMVVTTSVAAQSKELSALRTEATTLGYTAANLNTQLQEKSSSASLVLRASDAGMVPNPSPVFIRLADNAILGEPTPATKADAPAVLHLTTGDGLAAGESETMAGLPLAPGSDR